MVCIAIPVILSCFMAFISNTIKVFNFHSSSFTNVLRDDYDGWPSDVYRPISKIACLV